LAQEPHHLAGNLAKIGARAGRSSNPDPPSSRVAKPGRRETKRLPEETFRAISPDGWTDLPARDERDAAVILGLASAYERHEDAVKGFT